MSIVAIIQARCGSKRLPNKVLMDIGGKPMLERVIDQIKQCKEVEQIVVATTTLCQDIPIVELVESWGGCVGLFMGQELDVLDRFYKAAKRYDASVILRVTADDPLRDPDIMTRVIKEVERGYDYVGTQRFPIGVGSEAFTFDCLERAWQGATSKYDREHVTSYIYRRPKKFKLNWFYSYRNQSWKRLTVDTLEDLERIRKIYATNNR